MRHALAISDVDRGSRANRGSDRVIVHEAQVAAREPSGRGLTMSRAEIGEVGW